MCLLGAATVLGPTASFAGVPTKPTTTSMTATQFTLTVEGHSLASFTKLVSISSMVVDPGKKSSKKTITVVLRRPATRNIEMAAWHELVVLGDVATARKSVSLTAFGSNGDPVMRYHLTNAYPMKVELSGDGVLMETVTMTCDVMQRVSV